MKTIVTIIAAMLLVSINEISVSQTNGVGINATGATPAPSAMLDVSSASSGLLIPRMTEVQKIAIASPATGLMVYQTDGVQGFWYYNGSGWVQAVGPAGATGAIGPTGANGALNAWGLSGNAGTDSTVNFAGTTDAEALVLKTNNSERVRVNKVGRIGIGTAAPDPSALLDIKSTTNGMLIPRMNTAQRNAIASPAMGLQIYNTDCNGLNYYNGSCWLSTGASLPAPAPITSNNSTILCANSTGVTYTVPAVTGATTYNWTVPPGATFTGQGSPTITVAYGNVSGQICVAANNACETSPTTCVSINISPVIIANAGPNLQYYSSSCSAVTIGGSPTAFGGGGTYTYLWNPSTGLSSATIANPTANPTATTTYTVTVTSGGCTASSSMIFSVATGGTLTFSYTGTPQTWIVPVGVTCINITASGAGGGSGYYNGVVPAGQGGTVSGIKLVTPGTILTINVGQQGGNASSSAAGIGGINGGGNGGYYSSNYNGGGGGGASDVMLGGTALSNRIIVGAGGGGGGGCSANSNGGNGGYPYGGNGLLSGSYNGSYCGSGGTVFSGGAGGNSSYPGIAGGLGYGGIASSYGGGGGGGGYYGGGGGASSSGSTNGGGGGGSSYFGGMSSNTLFTNGNTSGNGQVIISW